MEVQTDLCLHRAEKFRVSYVSGQLVVEVDVCFQCAYALRQASAQLMASIPEEVEHEHRPEAGPA